MQNESKSNSKLKTKCFDSYTFESSLQTIAKPIYFVQPAAVCQAIHEYTFFVSRITELQLVIQSCVVWSVLYNLGYWLYWLTASLFACM